MKIGILFLVLFLLDAVLHLVGEWMILHDSPIGMRMRYFTKPFLMPLLGCYYIFTQLPDLVNIWIILGILGGLGGDVGLMLPDPRGKKTGFKLGLISFLLGHVFYIIAFIQAAGNFQGYLWWTSFFTIPYIVHGIIVYPKLTKHTGPLTIPVTIYIFVIVIMGISTGLLWGIKNPTGILIAMIGAWFFIISDTINAYNKFVHEIHNERLFTMSTYLLGQFLLILGYLLL